MCVCICVCMCVNKNWDKKQICEEANRVWGFIFGMSHGARVYNIFVTDFFFREDPLVSENGCERDISTKIVVVAENLKKKKWFLL